ncbi:hypothetical protein V6N13_089398 [Hibiscus sabdariffa]
MDSSISSSDINGGLSLVNLVNEKVGGSFGWTDLKKPEEVVDAGEAGSSNVVPHADVEVVKGKGLPEVDLVLSESCFNEVTQDRLTHLKNLLDSPHSLEIVLALNVHRSIVNIVGANCLVDPLSSNNYTSVEHCFGGLVSVQNPLDQGYSMGRMLEVEGVVGPQSLAPERASDDDRLIGLNVERVGEDCMLVRNMEGGDASDEASKLCALEGERLLRMDNVNFEAKCEMVQGVNSIKSWAELVDTLVYVNYQQ